MPARTILAFCAFSVVLMLLFPAFQGLATEDICPGNRPGMQGVSPRPLGRRRAQPCREGVSRRAGGSRESAPVFLPVSPLVRFAAGFLHLLTAVMWFGTILYVHLLLKPAYASHGLPRGELIVGWGSIALIAVTGTILTFYRVPSTDVLLHTRFGQLLMAKISIFLVMTATAFIVTFVVGPRLKARHVNVDPQKRDMTMEELSSFTGKDGSPAYFAYRGTIYDASGSKLWRKGLHVGKHQAGFDLTDVLMLAPHEEDQILRLPVVGKIVGRAAQERKPPHLVAFYFMTFLNLFLVLAVLLIIAVWRWG